MANSKFFNFSKSLMLLNAIILLVAFVTYFSLCSDTLCYQFDTRVSFLFVITISGVFSILLFEMILRIDPIIEEQPQQ